MKTKHKKNKQVENPLDTTCWFVNPFDVCKRVYNQKGKVVELNNAQSDDDYRFFKELNLVQDNYENGRYTTVCPFLYECIVYGHNYRYGYLRPDEKTQSLTEAILVVRTNFTKLFKGDEPENERMN